MGTEHLARAIIMAGLVAVAVGGLLLLVSRVGGWPRIPGDMVIQRPGTTIFLPVGTSVLISVLLTLGAALYRLLRG